MLLYDNLAAHIEGEKRRLEELLSSNIPEIGVISHVFRPAENQDKKTNLAGYSVTHETDRISVDYEGILGDRHRRKFRTRTGRESALYKGDAVIREHRHLFAVSLHDCDTLSERLGVKITPEMLGANLVISRVDGASYSLSRIPPETHMIIGDIGSTEMARPPVATLKRYAQQQGCGITGHSIAEIYRDNTLTSRFVNEAKDHRGIVFAVEYPVVTPAFLEPGQTVFFKFPTGRAP